MSGWTYNGSYITEAPEKVVGYIYCITNLTNNRKYIGKKLFNFSKTSIKTITLKNGTKKKKKIKSLVESDWKMYWSSSDELKKDVSLLGEHNFSREILLYCLSKNELSYYEAKLQFQHDVLLHESQWYNGWISVRVRKIKDNGKN